MKHTIPYKVMQSATPILETLDGIIKYSGTYEGNEIYYFSPKENVEIGFPIVFSYNKDENIVSEISGPESFRVLNLAKNK
ncbi:MAG: hypothetical protein II361_05545 [Alistipes sp.]|nr:hypothetical protein [Alistipes sp.]